MTPQPDAPDQTASTGPRPRSKVRSHSVNAETDNHTGQIPRRRRRGLFFVASGLLAAAAGLAVGEVLAAWSFSLQSPIIGVGNRAIDLAPPPVKRFAIRTFGTHDKQALLIGMALAIAVFAAVVGALSRKRPVAAVLAMLGFGALGATAAATGRNGSVIAAIPSLIAALVATLVMLGLRAAFGADREAHTGSDARRGDLDTNELTVPRPTAPTRRGVLALGGVAVATAAMGTTARRIRSATTKRLERSRRALPVPNQALPTVTTFVSVSELTDRTPFFTPNRDFYRIDTALVVPAVDLSTWQLTVKGLVDHERTYTYDDLLAKGLIEQDITLTCVSNEVGGILMGNARWTGIALQDLLDEAGVQSGATQIIGRSVDGWTAGFPVAALSKGSRAIVALGMNGDPLPAQHGFPARLVVPGIYGYASATKWLRSIELTTMDTRGYWVPKGYAQLAPIKLSSRIDVPQGLTTVPAGRVAIAGVAWSQTVGIQSVELSIDGGPWVEAELAEELSLDTWRQWRYAWDAEPGQHEITVRATDHGGHLQREERVAPLPDGATGWHQIVVFVA